MRQKRSLENCQEPDFRAASDPTFASDRVRISQVARLPPKPDDLRALLLRYLSSAGVSDVEQAEPLGILLARCDAAVD